jgi:hypothetical protein
MRLYPGPGFYARGQTLTDLVKNPPPFGEIRLRATRGCERFTSVTSERGLDGGTMKRFTDAGRSCLESGNLYGALSLALMLPDICASLEDPGPGKSKLRYERWCKKWIEPLHMHQAANGNPSEPFLPASDCYQLRCSLIHSGAGDVAEGKQQDIDHSITQVFILLRWTVTTIPAVCRWVSTIFNYPFPLTPPSPCPAT